MDSGLNKDHFVVKSIGKTPVHIYFSQTHAMTSCVARIAEKNGKALKFLVLASGESFFNPKDIWNEFVGKQKAFGKMKENLFTNYVPNFLYSYDVVFGVVTCIVGNGIQKMASTISTKGDKYPSEKEFEHAFWNWYKRFKENNDGNQ